MISNRNWLTIFPALTVQAVLSFCVFWYDQPFIIRQSFFEFFSLYFQNLENGSESYILVGDLNLKYLLSAPAAELEEYYPRWGKLFYVIGLAIRYLLPTALLVWLIRSIWRSFYQTLVDYFIKLNVRLLIATLLALQLAVYFLFRDNHINPVEFQIELARILLALNLVLFGIHILLRKKHYAGIIREFLFRPSLPYSLAITRALFFAYAMFLYLFVFRHGSDISLGLLEKEALPGIGWLIDLLPVNSKIYELSCYAGALTSLFIVFGYRTRFFLIINSIIVFYVVAAPNFYGKLWHGQIFIWITWILAFSPCFDVLSLDALRKKSAKKKASWRYGFHLKLIWLHFGHIYFFAGFYKLWVSGFDWALTDSIVHLVQIEWFEHYDKVSDWRIDKVPALLKAGALGVILFEMAYPLLLFDSRLKWASVFGGLALHNFLGKIMYISFFVMLQVFYLVFIPWNWLLTKFGLVTNQSEDIDQGRFYFVPSVLFPTGILILNLLCGVFMVNSYPFSIYPVYTDIREENVKYLEYEILDENYRHLDFREEGASHGFRWEDHSRHEYELIRLFEENGALDTHQVEKLWNRWQIGVNSLRNVDSVDVYIIERPLQPERSHIRFSKEYMMSIRQNKNRIQP